MKKVKQEQIKREVEQEVKPQEVVEGANPEFAALVSKFVKDVEDLQAREKKSEDKINRNWGLVMMSSNVGTTQTHQEGIILGSSTSIAQSFKALQMQFEKMCIKNVNSIGISYLMC